MSGWVILLISLALLPVILLIVPLVFKAGGSLSPQASRADINLSWGLGLVTAAFDVKGKKTSFRLRLAGITIPVLQKNPGTTGAAKAAKKLKDAGREGCAGHSFLAIDVMQNRQLWAVVVKYLKNVFMSFRLQLSLRGVYGFDDPALTGLFTGLIAALDAGRIRLDLNADFTIVPGR